MRKVVICSRPRLGGGHHLAHKHATHNAAADNVSLHGACIFVAAPRGTFSNLSNIFLNMLNHVALIRWLFKTNISVQNEGRGPCRAPRCYLRYATTQRIALVHGEPEIVVFPAALERSQNALLGACWEIHKI